ncbi:hypothetical protein diail_7438 [Diaporthe ilicicola]|nr:hypothetical protein diail_7438 [Diaporthe ilicicola]
MRQLLEESSKDSTTDHACSSSSSKGGIHGQPEMVASFYGIFGRAHAGDLGIEPEVFFESRGAGAVVQFLAARDRRLQFVTLKPLPPGPQQQKVSPGAGSTERGPRYGDDEMDAYAASIAHVAVCPGVTFAVLWSRADRSSARLLRQEEGFITRWHGLGGRVVLVGDAVHKSTSVIGPGMTCGLHSAAALANLLYEVVHRREGYQREREGEVKPVWDRGSAMVREVTRNSWGSWFWDSYVLPWVDPKRFGGGIIPSLGLVRHGKVLKWVPFGGREGKIPWLCRPSDKMGALLVYYSDFTRTHASSKVV